MKRNLLFTIILFVSSILYAQEPEVVFTRFELKPYSMLVNSDGWNLRSNFKVKSNKAIKYMEVFYLAINSVGDAVEDKIKRVKKFSANYTGPFNPGASKKMVVEFAVWHVLKNTAYPHKLDIEFMDGSKKEIVINKDNLQAYFPCLEYINVNDLKNVIANSDTPKIETKTINNHFPENEYGEPEFSEIIDCSLTKGELFQNAKRWAVSTFYDYKEVLQFEEPELGRLIVKGIYKPETLGNVINKESEEFRFTITFDFKDNKYRYKINGFESDITAVENDVLIHKKITPKERVEHLFKILEENNPASSAKANTQVEFYNMEYDFIVKLIEKMKREIVTNDDF